MEVVERVGEIFQPTHVLVERSRSSNSIADATMRETNVTHERWACEQATCFGQAGGCRSKLRMVSKVRAEFFD